RAQRSRGVVDTGSRHVAQHVAGFLAPGALEPPASVAEAVSSLTIADAFIAAGESPTPPPAALPRRFICSFPDCSANYNKAWKLDAHLCKHTGERPFVCDHEGCGKAFVRDYHLSRHALTHTGEKPFVCAASGCDQKFNTKSNLKKHFERKHENQQKQYVVCPRRMRETLRFPQQPEAAREGPRRCVRWPRCSRRPTAAVQVFVQSSTRVQAHPEKLKLCRQQHHAAGFALGQRGTECCYLSFSCLPVPFFSLLACRGLGLQFEVFRLMGL
uniref:Transcription factor IIIA n=1 Tax=Sus scrofa TaxID=9823 RepID=A0A8D0SDK7_PIG